MTALGFAVYGRQVRHGGFLIDDWFIASQYQEPTHPGFGLVHTYLTSYGQRPVSALYLLSTQAVFGLHMTAFLAWSVVLVASTATLLFILLRQLGLERIHAAVIAALVLVFPTADSTVLWVTGSNAHVDMSLYLAGAIVAVHGLPKSGREAVKWHSAAVALYLLSMLFAETTAGPVVLSVLLYRMRVPWRAAARRWAVDVIAAIAAVAYIGSRTSQPILSIHGEWTHVTNLFHGAVRIIELAGLTSGSTRIPAAAIVVLAALAIVGWFVLPKRNVIRSELGRWTVIAAGGIVAIAAGYLMYVPAPSYYTPNAQGIGNRVNALAAVGYAIFLYAIAGLLGLGVRSLWKGRLLSLSVTLALAGSVAVLWIGAVAKDQGAYVRAFALAKNSLVVIDRRVPKPQHGTTVYTFGLPKETASVVPVWDAWWDLTGALRILWHDHTLNGVPSPTITAVHCGARSIRPIGGAYTGTFGAPYGKAVFVDVPSEVVRVIDSRAACEAASRRYVEIHIPADGSLPRAVVGRPYLRRLQATGGTPPYQWAVTSGALPSGMSLWSTGELTGTPGAAGTFRFSVSATDDAQARGTQTAAYVLRVVEK